MRSSINHETGYGKMTGMQDFCTVLLTKGSAVLD